MVKGFYDDVMLELQDRDVYKSEVFAPFYICSMGMHMLNLANSKQKFYWEGKRLPNMRAHLLFIAPPGFMKSYYMQTMGGDDYGIFRNCDIKIGYEQYMTEAGFVGSVSNAGGVSIPIEGAAKTYDEGLLIIDEFSAITKAMQSTHSSQLDSQMLSALDHGHITKRLGLGKIEYTTRLTMWGGIQPSRFDLTSGIGRRIQYMIFIPTQKDNEMLLDAMHRARNMEPNVREMEKLWETIRKFKKSLEIVKKVEFNDNVLKMYKELKLFSFEGSYFDRLLLGYAISMYGPDKVVHVDVNDKELLDLIKREKKWRGDISSGVEYIQMTKIITEFGGQVKTSEITQEAAMYGWTAEQVLDILATMRSHGLIKHGKGVISLTELEI